MTVPFRWPWIPHPDMPDPELTRRADRSRVVWTQAADELRRALLDADEFVKAEQQEDHGGA